MTRRRVLQIIHVTDLHIRDSVFTEQQRFALEQRIWGRLLSRVCRRTNALEWAEGTQGHYPAAPRSFRSFLQRLVVVSPKWFADEEGRRPETWLVCTGDLTTYGDSRSLELAETYLAEWLQALPGARMRSIYGNHDAWPSCGPGTNIGSLDADHAKQISQLQARAGWSPSDWIDAPLSITIPGTANAIELYALDSIHSTPLGNIRAIGDLRSADIVKLQQAIAARLTAPGRKSYRILATHHPVTFPYRYMDTHVFGIPGLTKMRLQYAATVQAQLQNIRGVPAVGPLAHLILSGHSHEQYPTGKWSPAVVGMRQKGMGESQLQLVAGPLGLNRGSSAAANTYASGEGCPKPNCQAEILRFYAADDADEQLILRRTSVRSITGHYYGTVTPVQETTVSY